MAERELLKMKLESGDIGAVKGEGVLPKLNAELTEPYTDRFHFFLVWKKAGDDWIILESIGKGIAVGRLSFYAGQDVKIYRVNCPAYYRHRAPLELTKWGRAKYDYILILKIFAQGIWAIFKNFLKGEGIHPIKASDISWKHNSTLVCTEAVDIAYLSVGVSLTGGAVPLPSAFKQAELDGFMEEI